MRASKKYNYPRTNKKKKRVKIKKKKVLKILLLSLLVLLILALGISLRAALNINSLETASDWTNKLTEIEYEEEREANTVFAILNLNGDLDYSLIINYQFNEGTGDDSFELDDINGVLLPGTTYLEVMDQDRATLQEAYEWGGEALLLKTIEQNFGLSLNNFLKIDPILGEKLTEEFDFVGEVELPEFEPFVGDTEEFLDRIMSKDDILVKLKDEYLKESSFWNRSRYLNKISEHVETNLTWEQAGRYIYNLEDILSKENELQLIPGIIESIDGESYWVLQHEKTSELIDDMFLSDDLISQNLSPEDITVEVISVNEKEKAEKVGEILGEKGFVVKKVEKNKDLDYDSTLVISREAPETAAKMVALEVDGANLVNEPDPDSLVMVTVIIGKNYP